MSVDDAYSVLMERIEYPNSVRLRSVLELLMTPEEARMVAALPGSPEEVAEKTGLPLEQVRTALDELYFKGVVFPKDYDKRNFFRFARSILQLHDATQATQMRDVVRDRNFYSAWQDFCVEEWYPRVAQQIDQLPKPHDRVIPAYKSIKDLPGVLPEESFPELLKAQRLIAVTPCSCRWRTASIGKRCERTDEVAEWHCLQFGRGAEYALKRGSGKKLSLDEALALADRIEEDGLVHMWRNDMSMVGNSTSCQCCRDCCQVHVPCDTHSVDIGKIYEKSRYEAFVDLEDCNGCQECVERCQFDAIEMVKSAESRKYRATVDAAKCWGCGACVTGCATGAAKMRVARPASHIPAAMA